MKKLILLTVSLFMGLGTIFAGHDHPIKVEQLPEKAQKFLTTYWNDVKVVKAEMDKDGLEVTYDVHLENNTKIEFDKKGEWKEIKSPMTEIPKGVIIQNIVDYVANNYSGSRIEKIKREHHHYEVELTNDIELKFNKKGEFKRIDY
ncbi:MAG: PepSY-like domain-containing protein [Bacteroidales bacterium]|nr:PepSY-like domain-containing protein [Bacteroidales bacterium]